MNECVSVEFRGHRVDLYAADSVTLTAVRQAFDAFPPVTQGREGEALRVRPDGSGFAIWRGEERVVEKESLAEIRRTLRHEIILSFVRAHPDLLWLHAGAAVHRGRAVLFIGQYGKGKSTLVTELCSRGWGYLSDDIVPIDLARDHAIPFPLTPVVRQSGSAQLPPERIPELRKLKVPVPRSARQKDPIPIGGVVLPAYKQGCLATNRGHSPADVALAILGEAINRDLHRQASVALAARLVNRVPVLALDYSSAPDGAFLVEQTMSHLQRN